MEAVDLFAGWGGFTLGAEQAGVRVAWAANHWDVAVRAHARNHPDTAHACQDLRQADWTSLPAHDLLLASPACQGHSPASQPKRRRYHDGLRATAWAVVDCAEVTEPRALIVENVPAFRRWRLYPIWCQALEALGYRLQERTIVASQHGVPQRRARLFVVGTRGRGIPNLDFEPTVEPGFGASVQWQLGRWKPVGVAADGARARIANAVARHGPRCLSQHVTGHPGVPLTEPIRTITTKDQWVVVNRGRYRALTVRETARAMGFPEDYSWPVGVGRPDCLKGLGNAVCPPVARAVVARVADAC